MRSIRPIQRLIDQLEGLPGVGPKTAQRLAYYMLRFPQDRLERFAEAVERLKKDTRICEKCFNVDEESPCKICADMNRESQVICVVETPLDLLALERSDGYRGVYHVLHGVINPLNNIGPNDIYLPQLLKRLKDEVVEELIISTNPSMEGEATAMYIANKVREIQKLKFKSRNDSSHSVVGSETKIRDKSSEIRDQLKITRIGRGLPTGADLEYADDVTLSRAMEGRKEM